MRTGLVAAVVACGLLAASGCTALPPTTRPLPVVDLDATVGFGQLTARLPSGLDGVPSALGADALEAIELVALDPETGRELGRSPFRGADRPIALIRDLPDGPTATRIDVEGTAVAAGPLIELPDDSPPSPGLYDQALEPGFNYLEVRDGTTLSAFVSLPGDPADGPYPTLVEYSGYEPSNPLADDPTRDIVGLFGYALVQVNVRGTGCSGGSFDAFEPIQRLDGYDVIETVAAQEWAGKVGMWGISYPGIMQLHVASANPPNLAAIAPLSVIGDVSSVLFPGGIYNDGFGEAWTEQVSDRAQAFGQPWTRQRVDAGDQACEANQGLRIHNPDPLARIRSDRLFEVLAPSRSPEVAGIDVPVFLAGGWQDEQTGAGFADLLSKFSEAPVLHAVLYNGLHTDALGPHALSRLVEFYELFVAERSPRLDAVTRLTAGAALSTVFGAFVALPPSSYFGQPVGEARADYADAAGIEVLFEVGGTRPNLPVPTFVRTFEQWPPAATEALTFHLEGDQLVETVPASTGAAELTTEPSEGAETTAADISRIWGTSPNWSWTADPADLTFTSAPTDADAVLLGTATVDLMVSTTGDTEIEATLSEIAPDGSETYIQSGWAKVAFDQHQHDSLQLVILPVGHVLRAGSRLRLTIDSPGASKPRWTFATSPTPALVTIHTGSALGADGPNQRGGLEVSSLTVPVLTGLDVPPGRPTCGSLRGQPCRP